MPDKHLFIITGCNGAGKTTASFTILPDLLDCREFINADEIARGLSPFQPEQVAVEAGRIMLHRVDELLERGVDFAFETTLSTRSYTARIKEAQRKGYFVTLLFFWLESADMAIDRVKTRVTEGGHNIPDNVVKRRYIRGLKNLFELYMPVCDRSMVIDSSHGNCTFVMSQNKGSEPEIFNDFLLKQIRDSAHE